MEATFEESVNISDLIVSEDFAYDDGAPLAPETLLKSNAVDVFL
jgi:hypothetical protein